MTSKRDTSKRSKSRAKAKRATRAARPESHHEHRDRLLRAKRVLRALRHTVLFPRAVIHTNKAHIPAEMLEQVPEQALVEHWEAMSELKGKGIEIRPTSARVPKAHLLREIELDAPVSSHARHFASQHGLVIKERKSPLRSSLERIFG